MDYQKRISNYLNGLRMVNGNAAFESNNISINNEMRPLNCAKEQFLIDDFNINMPPSMSMEDVLEEHLIANASSNELIFEEVISNDWMIRGGEECVEVDAKEIQIFQDSQQETVEILVQNPYHARQPIPCDYCDKRFCFEHELKEHLRKHYVHSEVYRRRRHAKMRANDLRFRNHQQQEHHLQQSDFAQVHGKPQHKPLDEAMEKADVTVKLKGQPIQTHNNKLPVSAPRGRISRLKPKIFSYTSQNDALTCQIWHCDTKEKNLDEAEDEIPASKLTPVPAVQVKDKTSYRSALVILDARKPYVCNICELSFTREKALKTHLNSHRDNSPAECPQCNRFLSNQAELEEHLRMSHTCDESNSDYEPSDADVSDSDKATRIDLYCCLECNLSFHRKDALTRHQKCHPKPNKSIVYTPSQRHCCHKCQQEFATPGELLAHVEIHGDSAEYRCTFCSETYSDQSKIKQHLRAMHMKYMEKYSCILCGRNCRTHTALLKHIYDHNNEKHFKCGSCGKSFCSQTRLTRHLSSHTDKTKKCNKCSQSFVDGRALANHMHSHTNDPAAKKFPCGYCEKSFGSRSSQQIHIRTHTGEKPYHCMWCKKKFADGGTLRKHERTHTGEKPYGCCACSRKFNQRVVLRDHLRAQHSGKDPAVDKFRCCVCEEEFSNGKEQCEHYLQHCDEKTRAERAPKAKPRTYMRRRQLQPHELERLGQIKMEDEEESLEQDQETNENIDLSTTEQNLPANSDFDVLLFDGKNRQYEPNRKRLLNENKNGYSAHAKRLRNSSRSPTETTINTSNRCKKKIDENTDDAQHKRFLSSDFSEDFDVNVNPAAQIIPSVLDWPLMDNPISCFDNFDLATPPNSNLKNGQPERSRLISETLSTEGELSAVVKTEVNYSDFNFPEFDIQSPANVFCQRPIQIEDEQSLQPYN